MPFHHEWAWYNINFPNPDGAICRLGMEDQEWHRMTRRRDFDWYGSQLETHKIHLANRGSLHPPVCADNSTPHLLPPAGATSCTHARRHPSFYYELYYRMLLERECLVRQGLLPAELPAPLAPKRQLGKGVKSSAIMTMAQRKAEDARVCKCAVEQMVKEGWFDGAYARRQL